jgi:hypothetical protein
MGQTAEKLWNDLYLGQEIYLFPQASQWALEPIHPVHWVPDIMWPELEANDCPPISLLRYNEIKRICF